ncbi:MAG TPA: UDP-N-acetylglucosamine 2-epimerase (non-hydrolyzing) [Candidatus Limnocylindria bacterium]|nr:UDP-N-acetylglucosamine 2-epimerase (non-hydrolyzing) [Candidatus Limnocylindria bacterium]
MRVLSVVGARPQFVKAGPVSRVLRTRHSELLVHTGQHYDDAMSGAFFRELQIPEPDANLEVGSGSHAAMTAEMLRRLEPLVERHAPDVILVYGDTNSTLAASVVGCKVVYADGAQPLLAHVEAGLRSFNPRMPEERNRIVADHLSDLLLAPTPAAMGNLAREGLGERAELVGDVMVDAYLVAAERADGSVLPEPARQRSGYLLLTLHRAENVDDPLRLRAWLDAFDLPEQPVIFPVHPRTAAVMARFGLRPPENVVAMKPVGYPTMVALERQARAVATDSGGVQKEAYLAGVPCLTLRGETEWIETVEAGWNRLVPASRTAVRAALADRGFLDRRRPRPPLFGDGRTAERIVDVLERAVAARRSPPRPRGEAVLEPTAS